MLKPRLYIKGLSGLLSPGKEKKGKENETNGKAHPVKATHFDYITKPGSSSNGRSSQERPRAPKQHQPQGHGYSHSSSSRQDRPPREDRRYHRHSTGEYRNGSSSMQHHHRPDAERRYSREDDEELMRIHSQGQKYDDRGERRSGSLPGHYSQDSRGKNRGGSLPGHYSQGSPTALRGPPKPPRRQESLNKVHIPERPPDTDFTTSASDYEIFSHSSGSSSPKNWKVSPLSGQNSSTSKHLRDRSWSPSKEYSRSPPRRERSPDRKQRHYDDPQYDQGDPYGQRDRSPDRKQKHYDNHKNERNGHSGKRDISPERKQRLYNDQQDTRSDHYGKRDISPERKQRHYNDQQDTRSDHHDKRDMSADRKQRHYNNQQDALSDHHGKRDMSADRKQRHFNNQQDALSDHHGKRDMSADRKQRHYNNQQDALSDHYGKRDRSAERPDWQYSSSPQPSGNGYQKENKIKQPSIDPYRHDTGPSQYSPTPSPHDQYSYERTPTAYVEDYQQRPYNQPQKQKVTPDPYGNSWIKEKPMAQSRPTSNARPLVLPQGDKVPEAPRPIYRSDGEIDLREPTYKKSKEPDMFAINQAPPSHSYPSSPVSKPNTTNFNYYLEPFTEPEPMDMQWEEPNQQGGQTQPKHSNSLRTVRGVKAYDQHMKKFKRPTSLGGVPRQQQNTISQERPRSAIDHPASDDGLYPSLEHSRNSAFAAGSQKNPHSDSLYNNQFGFSTTNNNHQYSEPNKQTSHANGGYGMNNLQNNQPGTFNDAYDTNKGSNILPKDWPKDYPTQMTVRSPVPSDPENSVSTVKQVDSGKQTIFCLVSQVVPTSPSPEVSPGPMQREFVEIENGKVSPIMKRPINMPKPSHNQYNQSPVQNGYSQHGSYSPVRSQMEYQANQHVDPAWKQHVQKREGRQSVLSSLSQDSSTGNDSDFHSRQRRSPAGYGQQAPKIVPSQIAQKKDPVNLANPRESYRGASLSSGYYSSPEFEREHGQQPHPQKSFYERERFSDTEYRIGGTGREVEGDDVPIVPIKDLIKKINRDVETNGGLDLVVPTRPAPTGLKTILVRDAQQSNQQIKDDTCYGIRAASMDPKFKEIQTQTREVSGKVHPSAYYNEKYITATALPCEVIDASERKTERKTRVGACPLSAEVPITANIYREVESRPDVKQESPEESEEDAKPINAKERRAYFESLKPLSKEEEILSVVDSKSPTNNQTEVPASNGQQRGASQTNTMYGSIKWPKDYPVTEPAINKQTAKQNFSEPPKARKAERSPSPIRQNEVFYDDDQSKPGERQGYYDRLRQRGQGAGTGLMGRRSQSLPKLNSSTRNEKLESPKVPGPSLELTNGESGTKRLSMGAQLFQQKKLDMERHNKKQEIMEKVKSQLNIKRAGSEPDLTLKDKHNDALYSLEQNRHLLSTTVAGKRIRGRDSADFEYALNQLQTIHTEADQDADEILHPQYYRPFDHRAAEIPLLAQKVAELQELLGIHASPGSGKHRKKGKRATSDVSEMRPSPYEPNDGELQEKPGSAKKGQDFFPYRQATHPKKMAKKDELSLGCGHESTSDEDKTPRPAPPGTNTKLYRHPKSSDNLGFSSDSSPERPIRVKPKTVLPDHVRMASPELSVNASREQRRATRDAFFSGEDNSRGPSPLPLKSNSNRKPNSHHANLPPPIMQSVKFGESPKLKRAVLTKPPPAPALTKFKESQLYLQPPGSRDSVSTVDSAGLAQPFEDMTEEYENMMMDHQAIEMPIPDDPERTSSVESLMHLVSGSCRQQKNKAPKTYHNTSFSPGGNIPLADEDYVSSGDEGDLEGKTCPLVGIDDI